MDQIKVALSWLKEHHFWVLSVVVLGTAIGVWYMASGAIAGQYKANEAKITGEIANIDRLQSQPFKPNEGINNKQQLEVQQQAQNVLDEWRKLYQEQKEAVLIWPEELGQDFVKAVQNAKFGDPIIGRRRELYQTYIKGTFPNLLKIVDAEPLEGGRSSRGGGIGGFGGEGFGGGFGPDGGEEASEKYLVQWADQDALRSRLELKKQPSALQIWVLQEDLWVYTTLLQSIARTNEETKATRSERAAVQTIVELKVGQPAAGFDPTETRLASPDVDDNPSTGGFGGGDFGGDFGGGFGGGDFGGGFGGGDFGGGFGGGDFGGGGFGGGGAVGETSSQLLANRYLDGEGAPIADAGEDYSVFGREFKRLPVRLVLEMDSRWLSQLMWELANASMQVEIEEVRFNPDGQPGARRSSSGGSGQVEAFDRRPTYGTVVLQGIVYLFNEPDSSIATVEESF